MFLVELGRIGRLASAFSIFRVFLACLSSALGLDAHQLFIVAETDGNALAAGIFSWESLLPESDSCSWSLLSSSTAAESDDA